MAAYPIRRRIFVPAEAAVDSRGRRNRRQPETKKTVLAAFVLAWLFRPAESKGAPLIALGLQATSL
jgi:hypothetical protein